jgi:hypothetical protein
MEVPIPQSVAFPLVGFLIWTVIVAAIVIIATKLRDYFTNKRIVEKLIRSFEDVRRQLERLSTSDDNRTRNEYYIKLDDRPFGTWQRVDRQNREDDPLTDQINFFRRKLKFLPGSTRIRGIPTTELQKAEIRRYANATLVPLLDNIIANIRADYCGRQLWRPVKRD